MLSLIVARARGGAIGKDNTIPWRKPADLAAFKRETLGGAVIMGRRTWESLPFKPLPDRMNIVVSRDAGLTEHVVSSVEAALELASVAGHTRVYGIGGAGIYAALLPQAHRLLITEVDVQVEAPDAHFPEVDESAWTEISRIELGGSGPEAVLRELLRG